MQGKALFAIGMAVIAGVFVASMVKSRGPTNDELESRDELEKFAEREADLDREDDCRDAIGHAVSISGDYLTSRYGDGAPDAIRDITIHRCTMDQWSSDAIRCLDRVTSEAEMQRCIGKLEPHQRTAVEAEMKAFALRPPVVPPDASIDAPDYSYDDYAFDPVDAAVAGSGDLPVACTDYKQLIERLLVCDQIPQASRDAMKQGFDAMSQSWSSMGSMPQESRDAMGNACRQGADALKQVGTSMCGW